MGPMTDASPASVLSPLSDTEDDGTVALDSGSTYMSELGALYSAYT